MSLIKLTAPAFFYLRASFVLGHGHALGIKSSTITDDGYVYVDLPLLGSITAGETYDIESGQWLDKEAILGVREVDLLHQLKGRLVNREAPKGAIAGLEGWEVSGDWRRKAYSHRTATGRLRLTVVSETYHNMAGGQEEIWIEVCAGDGKTVAALIWRKGEWHKWYGAAEGMHGGSDDLPIETWLAEHNACARPDRFHALTEILFDGAEYVLPRESLADVEHWGVGAAIKACLGGTAFDIAEAHKTSQEVL